MGLSVGSLAKNLLFCQFFMSDNPLVLELCSVETSISKKTKKKKKVGNLDSPIHRKLHLFLVIGNRCVYIFEIFAYFCGYRPS